MNIYGAAGGVSLALLGFIGSVHGQLALVDCPSDQLNATAQYPYPDELGRDIALATSHNRVVMGRPGDTLFGYLAGSLAIFTYENGNWVNGVTVAPFDADGGDKLGSAVASAADFVVGGAPGRHGAVANSGAAIIFKWDGDEWNDLQDLEPSTSVANDRVGYAVAASESVILVGAPGTDPNGVVYVYRHNGQSWVQTQQLSPPKSDDVSEFGSSIAISNDMAIIGVESGGAYVFVDRGDTWVQQQCLSVEGHVCSVDLADTTAVLGVTQDQGDQAVVSAHVFRQLDGVWTQEDTLLTDGAVCNFLGTVDVAVRGDTIVVGSAGEITEDPCGGATYFFERTETRWLRQRRVMSPGPFASQGFGISVALSDQVAIVGQYANPFPHPERSVAYVYGDPSPLDCNQNGTSDACDIISGLSEDCNNNGTPDSCDLANGRSEDRDANGIPDECQPLSCEITRLTSDAVKLGTDIAVDGLRCAIGGVGMGDRTGQAMIYEYDGETWIEQSVATTMDETLSFAFLGIALRGDTLIVGDINVNDNAGAAYVFREVDGQWNQEAKLLPPAVGSLFGGSCAIGPESILVSWRSGDAVACYEPANGGWEFTHLLEVEHDEWFGVDLQVRGNRALIGSPGMDDDSGAAYIYRFIDGRWRQEHRLLPSDGTPDFGRVVAFEDEHIAVLATEFAIQEDSSSAIYFFELRNGFWVETQRLEPPGDPAAAGFGWSMSMSGDTLLVASLLNDSACPFGVDCNRGTCYVYHRTDGQWEFFRQLLPPPDIEDRRLFGWATALAGDTAFVSTSITPYDKDPGGGITDMQVSLIGGVTKSDCNQDNIGDACNIADGVLADHNRNFIPDACDIPADVNGDGDVDVLDLVGVILSWGACAKRCAADIDGDGVVGVEDLLAVIQAFDG